MASKPSPTRRRGAPNGNTNALKHGFYARRLPTADRRDLETHDFPGLAEEANILRVVIRRVVEMSAQVTTFEQNLSLLRTLSFSLISLSRVLRTDAIVNPPTSRSDDLAQSLDAALAEVLSEMAIGKELNPIESQKQFGPPSPTR